MIFRTLLLLLPVWSLACSAEAADRYQRWAEEEVGWIASRQELEEFASLSEGAEKEVFIDGFWRRRDPTPGTPRNEYKEEHYRRLEHVKTQFREGIPGWKTDRGRIYVVHGEPDRVEFMLPDRLGEKETVIWTYFAVPTAKYSKGRMVLVFEASIGSTLQDVQLGESRTGRQTAARNLRRGGIPQTDLVRSASRYRLVAAGPPAAVNTRGMDVPASGIGEFARYVEDLLRSPGELLEELDQEEQRRQASRQELRQQIRTRVSYDSLPFSMSVQDFYSGEDALVSLAWQIPLQSMNFEEEGGVHRGKIDLMAQILNPAGELVDEFFKSIELAYSREEWESRRDGPYHYLNHFTVGPGHYRVTSILRDVQSGRLGTALREVECIGLQPGQIALSGLVLSRTLAPLDEASTGTELIHQDWKVIPESDGEFGNSDQMILFFRVYNAQPTPAGQPEVVVSYSFFREDQLIKTSGPRPLSEFNDGQAAVISYSTVVDLASFSPGDYLLQVNAIDFQSRKYALQRTSFRIGP